MQKFFIRAAAISAAIAVILGALGAHALKTKLGPDQLQGFETAVKYQMYHSLALLALPLLINVLNTTMLRYAGLFFITGMVFFSGSIYLLSTRTLTGMEGLSILGPVTPIGGLFLIAGWIFVFIATIKKNH
jgi:uncharacterized membrane protein YgdD (TMEM256/DUF423 family)